MQQYQPIRQAPSNRKVQSNESRRRRRQARERAEAAARRQQRGRRARALGPAEIAITEGIHRKRHVEGSVSNILRGTNRFSVLPIPNLEIPATSNEVILVWIDGEQDADTSLRIGVKYHEVPVLFGSYVHAYTVAEIEIVLAAEPHSQRWVLLDG